MKKKIQQKSTQLSTTTFRMALILFVQKLLLENTSLKFQFNVKTILVIKLCSWQKSTFNSGYEFNSKGMARKRISRLNIWNYNQYNFEFKHKLYSTKSQLYNIRANCWHLKLNWMLNRNKSEMALKANNFPFSVFICTW